MDSYPKAAMERAMKVQDVMLQAMAKKITWWQAAEILGISDRHMRRWRERYVEEGYDGLFDRRRGKPSRRRVPLATVEKVLALYREKYFDLNVQHFHEKLEAEHGIELSYTWVKQALQGGAGSAGTQARGASQTACPAALAGDAVAHRWQPSSVVSGRTLVRPDRDYGRRHQRDLLRTSGGGGIDADGDGGTEGSDRA
jgi:transposase